MLGFDRGGAYPQVFSHCREQDVHWVTTGAPLAVRVMLPVITTITAAGGPAIRSRPRRPCRSATTAKPGRSPVRVRQDRLGDPDLALRHLPGGYPGLAEIPVARRELPQVRARTTGSTPRLPRQHRDEHQDRDNPARKAASAAVRDAEKTLASAERALAGLLAYLVITPAAKNAAIPAMQKKITRARQAAAAATAARKDIPAKLPASAIDPGAKVALLRTGRRGLQTGAATAHNAEHWLSNQLNAYPRRRRIPRHHPRNHHPRPGRHHHLVAAIPPGAAPRPPDASPAPSHC